MLRVRKSVNSLTAAEKAALVKAITKLKASGKYDAYVDEHNAAMATASVLPGEPDDPSYRNIAHAARPSGPGTARCCAASNSTCRPRCPA
jgi:hypothetical protein